MPEGAIGPGCHNVVAAFRLQPNVGREEWVDDHCPDLQGGGRSKENEATQAQVGRNRVELVPASDVECGDTQSGKEQQPRRKSTLSSRLLKRSRTFFR